MIKFLLKGFLSVLLGVQLIQSMILPAVDSMKIQFSKRNECHSRNRKWFEFSHDHGHRFGSCDQNSIGAVGILVLIVIIVPPVIEITAVVLTYLLAGIMIQPISDKRITGAMDAVIQSGKLMLSMIFTMALLFILSVALIAFSTNVNYYAG